MGNKSKKVADFIQEGLERLGIVAVEDTKTIGGNGNMFLREAKW